MTDTSFDLTIRNRPISNADGTFHADIGVRNGVIVEIAPKLAASTRDVDAAGRWVLPGGIDSHCHIEQLSGMGVVCADDFHSGTVSAAFAGTTTILSFAAHHPTPLLSFAAQHRTDSIPEVVAAYGKLARAKAVIDYGFHLILANPDETA